MEQNAKDFRAVVEHALGIELNHQQRVVLAHYTGWVDPRQPRWPTEQQIGAHLGAERSQPMVSKLKNRLQSDLEAK